MTGLWKTWMDIWVWAMLAAAAVFLLAATTATQAPALLFYDLIHWPIDGNTGFTEATRPTAAILGAVFLGWILTVRLLIGLANSAAAPAATRIWRGLTGTIAAWYVLDSGASVITGVPVNALSNTAILITYLIPVLASGVLAGKGAGGAA